MTVLRGWFSRNLGKRLGVYLSPSLLPLASVSAPWRSLCFDFSRQLKALGAREVPLSRVGATDLETGGTAFRPPTKSSPLT